MSDFRSDSSEAVDTGHALRSEAPSAASPSERPVAQSPQELPGADRPGVRGSGRPAGTSSAAKVCRWPRKHVWKVVDKIEQAAPIEVVQKAGVRKMEGSYDSWERMGTKPVVVTRRCECCGLEEVRRV